MVESSTSESRPTHGPRSGGSRNDAEVIECSLQTPELFGTIFERHFDEIHRYLRRRHPGEADELAAQVFTVAFDRRARFVALDGSARPWLYGIASNLLARSRRSEVRALRAHSRSARREGASPETLHESDERLDAERCSARVAAAVSGLGRKDRDTLLLYALSDLSYAEIAAALEVPIGTVRSRLARARRQCSETLRMGAEDD